MKIFNENNKVVSDIHFVITVVDHDYSYYVYAAARDAVATADLMFG